MKKNSFVFCFLFLIAPTVSCFSAQVEDFLSSNSEVRSAALQNLNQLSNEELNVLAQDLYAKAPPGSGPESPYAAEAIVAIQVIMMERLQSNVDAFEKGEFQEGEGAPSRDDSWTDSNGAGYKTRESAEGNYDTRQSGSDRYETRQSGEDRFKTHQSAKDRFNSR